MIGKSVLMFNEIKNDLINQAGISRSNFGCARERERDTYILLKLIFYAVLEGKLQTSKYRGFIRLNSDVEKISEIQWKKLLTIY